MPSINSLGLSRVTAVQREPGRHGRGCRRRAWRVQLDLAGGQMQMQMQTKTRPFAAAGEARRRARARLGLCLSAVVFFLAQAGLVGLAVSIVSCRCLSLSTASPRQTRLQTVPCPGAVLFLPPPTQQPTGPTHTGTAPALAAWVGGWSGSYLALDA
jgi:hypothetical protein